MVLPAAALLGLLLAAAALLPCLGGGVPGRGDLADFFWPMKTYTASCWKAGRIPLWNPLSGCGEPWLAQLQSGAVNPADLPFLLPWPWGPLGATALLVVVAATGMAAWLRRLGASRAGSLVAAGVYAGGGSFLSLIPFYNNAGTAAFLPWLFAGADGLARGGSPVPFAVSVGLAFLGGEPALALAGCAAAAVVGLATRREGETVPEARLPAIRRLLVGLVLGLGLAAAALAPFGALLLSSGRLATTTRAEALARPVGPSDLADLVLPPSSDATRALAAGRGDYLVTLALGPAPLLLAAAAAAGFPGRRRLLWILAAVGALAGLVAIGGRGPLLPLLVDAGLWKGLRFPARWFVFTHLALALAAGAGLDGWLYGRFSSRTAPGEAAGDAADPVEVEARRGARAAWLFAGAFIATTAIALVAVLAVPAIRASRDSRRAWLACGAAGVAALAVGAARARRERGPGAWAGLAAAAALAPLPFFSRDALAPVPGRGLLEPPPIVADLARDHPEGRVFSPVAGDRDLLSAWSIGGAGTWSAEVPLRSMRAVAGYSNLLPGISTATSPSPLPDPRRLRLLGVALAGGDPARILGLADVRWLVTPFPTSIAATRLDRRDGDLRRYRLSTFAGRVYSAFSARVATDDEAFDLLRRGAVDPQKTVLLAPGSPPVQLPGNARAGGYALSRVRRDEPELTEVETDASEPSLLVVTRTWDAGWSARVDGRPAPLLRAQLAFQAIPVPAGRHTVLLVYRPLTFQAGVLVSGVSLLLLAGLALAGSSRRS